MHQQAPPQERLEQEVVFVDLTSPFAALTYPLLELVVITGVMWMGIGYLDSPNAPWIVDVNLRNGLVGVWALLLIFRFVLPVARLRSRRFIVTNRRITLRGPSFRSSVHTIPLQAVKGVGRRRSTISLAVRGHDRPVVIPDVPRSRKVQARIEEALRHGH